MPEPRLFNFSVTGRGIFPLDMLRFDSCWPRFQDDTSTLYGSLTEGAAVTFTIYLVGLQTPSIGRWQSFGWQVKE